MLNLLNLMEAKKYRILVLTILLTISLVQSEENKCKENQTTCLDDNEAVFCIRKHEENGEFTKCENHKKTKKNKDSVQFLEESNYDEKAPNQRLLGDALCYNDQLLCYDDNGKEFCIPKNENGNRCDSFSINNKKNEDNNNDDDKNNQVECGIDEIECWENDFKFCIFEKIYVNNIEYRNRCPVSCKNNEKLCGDTQTKDSYCISNDQECPIICRYGEQLCHHYNGDEYCTLEEIDENGNFRMCPIECNEEFEITCSDKNRNNYCMPKTYDHFGKECENFCPQICEDGEDPCGITGFLNNGCPIKNLCPFKIFNYEGEITGIKCPVSCLITEKFCEGKNYDYCVSETMQCNN